MGLRPAPGTERADREAAEGIGTVRGRRDGASRLYSTEREHETAHRNRAHAHKIVLAHTSGSHSCGEHYKERVYPCQQSAAMRVDQSRDMNVGRNAREIFKLFGRSFVQMIEFFTFLLYTLSCKTANMNLTRY